MPGTLVDTSVWVAVFLLGSLLKQITPGADHWRRGTVL